MFISFVDFVGNQNDRYVNIDACEMISIEATNTENVSALVLSFPSGASRKITMDNFQAKCALNKIAQAISEGDRLLIIRPTPYGYR